MLHLDFIALAVFTRSISIRPSVADDFSLGRIPTKLPIQTLGAALCRSSTIGKPSLDSTGKVYLTGVNPARARVAGPG
jgi:hypothetical protein